MSGCGSKTYGYITSYKRDVILDALKKTGASISGSNPYVVTGLEAGVALNGQWDEAAQTILVTVTDSSWYAPCGKVWEKIDELVGKVQAMPEPKANAPRPPLADQHIANFRTAMRTISSTLPKLAKNTAKQAQAPAPTAAASAAGATSGMSTTTLALIGLGVAVGGYFLLKDK